MGGFDLGASAGTVQCASSGPSDLRVKTTAKMWIWCFAAGLFLMAAINGLANVIDGNGWLAWAQIVGSIVVVVAAVAILSKERQAERGAQPDS